MCQLSDRDWTRAYAEARSIITPFVGQNVKFDLGHPVISYGLDPQGYSPRLGHTVMRQVPMEEIDLHRPDAISWVKTIEEGSFKIDPGEFLLGETFEEITVPNDVMLLVLDKSSIARTGVHVLTTSAQPGWQGRLTLEIANLGRLPVRLYPGEGICQLIALRGERPALTYADLKGRYMNAQHVEGPR